MASSLVTGAETLTFARRKTSSSKLSLSGLCAHGRLLAPKRVSSCGLELSMGAGRFGPKCSLSANSPASEPSLSQLIRQLGSSKRSVVGEEGGSLIFPIVGDHIYVCSGR